MKVRVVMEKKEKEKWQRIEIEHLSQGWKKGWKLLLGVLGAHEEVFYYALKAHPHDGNHGFFEGRIEYPLGEIVVPKEGCGPLTIYTDNFSAQRWSNVYCAHSFYCVYNPSAEERVWHKYDGTEAELSDLEYGSALADELIVIPQALGVNGNPNNVGSIRRRGPWIV